MEICTKSYTYVTRCKIFYQIRWHIVFFQLLSLKYPTQRISKDCFTLSVCHLFDVTTTAPAPLTTTLSTNFVQVIRIWFQMENSMAVKVFGLS